MESLVFISIMLAVFLSYLITVWVKYRIHSSISKTYYSLKNEHKIWFTIFCWGISVFYLLASPTMLSFWAATGIILVGCHPFIKYKFHFIIHTIGAFLGILFSQLSVIFDYDQHILGLSYVLLFVLLIFVRNKYWWWEIFAFINVFICDVLTDGFKITLNIW